MSKAIKMSVLMSVYNTKAEYLNEAISSILNQTMPDFEFIIVDDKSTDGSLEIIRDRQRQDGRIVLIENSENLGLTKSLNKALKAAKGEYIVRMDADDVALPTRLEQQLRLMEEHPEYAASGGFVFISKERCLINRGYNMDSEITKIQMLFRNAGPPHPTAVFRKSFLDQNAITYDEAIHKSQDYGIWYDIVRQGGVIGCVPEVLLRYRVHDGQISAKSEDQKKYSNMVTRKALVQLIGSCDDDTLALHCSIAEGIPEREKQEYIRHLKTLEAANKKEGLYDPATFSAQISCFWLRMCLRRLKYKHDVSFLVSLYSLRCFRVKVVKNYYFTYRKNQSMYTQAKARYIGETSL